MLTIAPILAATGLLSYDPSRWGGELNLMNIIGLAIFGSISVPLWFTYIPSLIFTPIILKRLSEKDKFYTIPLWRFYIFSIFCGCVGGIFVLLPAILLSGPKSIDMALNWIWSGFIAGGITFPILSSLYRFTRIKTT